MLPCVIHSLIPSMIFSLFSVLGVSGEMATTTFLQWTNEILHRKFRFLVAKLFFYGHILFIPVKAVLDCYLGIRTS